MQEIHHIKITMPDKSVRWFEITYEVSENQTGGEMIVKVPFSERPCLCERREDESG